VPFTPNSFLCVSVVILFFFLCALCGESFYPKYASDISPVAEAGFFATCSGVPYATTVPPLSPPSGPRSMIQSAHLDNVEVVLDHDHGVALVNKLADHVMRSKISSKWRPVVGSSRM